MTKPIGAVCNLNCRYCYYLGKKDLYPATESYRMPDDLLESYIVQHIAAAPRQLIPFAWHGGERATPARVEAAKSLQVQV